MDAQSRQSLDEISRAVGRVTAAGGTVVIFGIGSELLGDDRAGVAVARAVKEKDLPLLKGVAGCSAPENVTGEVISHKPALVIVIDAADMGVAPGEVRIIPPENISGVTFSTHSLPLSMIIAYLKGSLSSEFLVVGIQPESTQFSQELSPPVASAVSLILASIGVGDAKR